MVELLLAIFLSTILITIALQLYLSVKKNYVLQQRLTEEQYKDMFISYFLATHRCRLSELHFKNKTLYWRKPKVGRSLALVSGITLFKIYKDGDKGAQVVFGVKKPWTIYIASKGLC